MSRNHRNRPDADRVVDSYLDRNGLSFDFDAGHETYDYMIAIGGRGADWLVGDSSRDYLWGRAGNDRLFGRAEEDVLYGDRGNDLLVGAMGAERLIGGSGHDLLFGGDQADGLMGGDGSDYLDEGAGHGMLEGGRGNDVLVGGQGPDAFMVDRESGHDVIRDFTAGPGMFDHLALSDLRWEDLRFEDTRHGVRISWDGGSALLEGVRQADLAQDDFMFANAPDLPPASRPPMGVAPERESPSSDGPDGPDRTGLPGRSFDRYADHQIDDGKFAFGFSGENAYHVVVGTSDADSGQGGETWDHFFGRDGNDTFAAGDGNDVLNGDAGDDQLDGGAGMDRLDGGMGNDRLRGADQADELMGAAGDDYLDEGAGHGMLDGGAGNDFFVGGTGADAFIVDAASGDDIVFDFEACGEAQGAFDHVALREISSEGVTVADGVTRAWDGQSYTGVLISWDVDGDTQPEGSILLAGLTSADLRQSDFMFVDEPGFVAGIDDFGSWYIFPEASSHIA
jgi:Ca2+-binding RTX toxin-like protein